ncbi:MAG: hypothetical protein WBF88_07165, partial [Pusillimonas sp.]
TEPADALDHQLEATQDGDQLDPERKRRRRRSRRGRRNNEAGVEANATQDSDSGDANDEGQAFVSHETPAFNPQVLPAIATTQGHTTEPVQNLAEAQLMPVETAQVDIEQAPVQPGTDAAAGQASQDEAADTTSPAVAESAPSTAAVSSEPTVRQEPALAEELTGTSETATGDQTASAGELETAPNGRQAVPAEQAPAVTVQPAPVADVQADSESKAATEDAMAIETPAPAEPALAEEVIAENTGSRQAATDDSFVGTAPAAKVVSTSLEQMLQVAGMQLIETSSAPATAQPPAAAVRLGRPRKPVAATATEEPLQQVETQ